MYNAQCKHNTDCVQAAWESLPPHWQNFTELWNSRFYSRLSQIAKICYLAGVPRKFFVADSKLFPTSLTQFVSRLLTSFFACVIWFAKYCSIIIWWKRSLQRMMLCCLKKGAWIMTLFWRHRCTVGLLRGADSQIGTLFKCIFFCFGTPDLLLISPSYSLFWSCQWHRWFALTFSCFIAEL